ncbi:type II secretion system F family protein [Nocardiopsis exhalans]|uniref:Type II secretion system F family protein n=2 Tax=Nocardiopsis exhalans TaxID=163604 RepID=A0ABY5D6M1_9ACTN|nr:type II secretion system F family protein [Nocardiopsis exhalans]USY18733.1 type II secretion system F family protein [Nocardiopsis exhalans]
MGSNPHGWARVLRQRHTWVRLAAASGAGALVGVVTGWPVGVVLAAAAGWWMPALLGPDTTSQKQADLAEALASWAEQLRDMITGASGLHQAIAATVPVAPEPIRAPVQGLEARLRAGQPMDQAAPVFARDVDSDLGDLVALTLTMGASRQSGDVAGALSRLAEAARERASSIARVSASRARVRSSVRIIAAATTIMLVGMVALNPGFLEPLGTVTGQLILGLVGGVWALSFFWLARLAAPAEQPRPFSPTPVNRAAVAGVGGGR